MRDDYRNAAHCRVDEETRKARNEAHRGFLLNGVSAVLLVYLAYKLAESFITKVATIGWNFERVISLVGAIVFAITGVILLIKTVKAILEFNREESANRKG